MWLFAKETYNGREFDTYGKFVDTNEDVSGSVLEDCGVKSVSASIC